MKYKKAQDILPEEIIRIIQEYVDGGYLYIPAKPEKRRAWGSQSGLKAELNQRNREILYKYIKGMSIEELTKYYYLTESSIRRIIREQKNII
ncbi:CD3324 family protein [Clostridium sp.]|uniref:CD3324 family protein n=1 Tax=Clostridium sp. TaxID=1506 RepID=UPI0025C3A829|nr:CD3324 family protein [Clostridium sp.]